MPIAIVAIHLADILHATCSAYIRTYVTHHNRLVKDQYSKFKESKEATPKCSKVSNPKSSPNRLGGP